MVSKLKLVVGLAVLALAFAIPGTVLAQSSHGHHCGKAHTKHSRAMGKHCAKHQYCACLIHLDHSPYKQMHQT